MCVCVSAHACKHKLMRTVTVYETIFLIWAVFLEHLMSQFCALPTAYFSKALITIITTTSYHFFLAPTPNVILQVKTDNGLKKTKPKLGGVLLVHHVKRRERTSAFQQSEPPSSQHWMSPDIWLRHSAGLFSFFCHYLVCIKRKRFIDVVQFFMLHCTFTWALAVFYIFVIWCFIVACIRIKVVCTGSLLVKYWASLICRIFLSNLVAIYVYPFITKFNWLFACWIDWLLIYIVLYILESSSFGTTSPSGDTCRQQTTFFTICRFPKWPHKWRMWFWN